MRSCSVGQHGTWTSREARTHLTRLTSTISPYCEKTARRSPSVSWYGRPPAKMYAECLNLACHEPESETPAAISCFVTFWVFFICVRGFMLANYFKHNSMLMQPFVTDCGQRLRRASFMQAHAGISHL